LIKLRKFKMSYDDLREFLDELERRNLVHHIKEEVNCELEISEITARVSGKYRENSKVLFFENVKNNGKISEIPVVTNIFGSIERMKLALGIKNFESFGDKFLKFLKFKPGGFFEKLHLLKELKDFSSYFPETFKSGKCKEVIINEDKVDLLKFPVLKLWPDDGGRFITLPMVFTKDPETGMRNVGMYRMQIFDKNTTGMHWHIHKDGAEHYSRAEKFNKKLEVAAYIGKATERLFLPFIKILIPEINDINLPVEGVFHNLCVVSINKKYPGHAKKVMFALWGLGQMMFTKIIIVVDADVNVQNIEDVLWVVGSRVEPKRDVVIIENAPADALENASEFKFLSSKLGIDATRKWKEEVNKELNSEVAEMSEEVKKKVDEKWDKFGF